jgi:hypothetical protein
MVYILQSPRGIRCASLCVCSIEVVTPIWLYMTFAGPRRTLPRQLHWAVPGQVRKTVHFLSSAPLKLKSAREIRPWSSTLLLAAAAEMWRTTLQGVNPLAASPNKSVFRALPAPGAPRGWGCAKAKAQEAKRPARILSSCINLASSCSVSSCSASSCSASSCSASSCSASSCSASSWLLRLAPAAPPPAAPPPAALPPAAPPPAGCLPVKISG